MVIQDIGVNSIEIQNPTKSPFSNVDLVWKDGFRHGNQNKVAIETIYIPHAHVFDFLPGERGVMQTTIESNISKNLSPQEDVNESMINNHLGHTCYGFKTYKPFPLVIFASSRVSHFCVL